MYSQKGEERYIVEYFKDFGKGKFLDFRAFEPFTFSNTRRLYEMGWKGIYLEPASIKFEMFVSEYGRDPEMVLLNKAVATYDGEITFYNCNDGPSTTEVSHKEKWLDKIQVWKEEIVPCISINTLLEQYAGQINFLNIDVEGTNYELLKAINPKYFHGIKMVCIEHDNHHEAMIDIFCKIGFRLIYFNDENIILVKGWPLPFINKRRSYKVLARDLESFRKTESQWIKSISESKAFFVLTNMKLSFKILIKKLLLKSIVPLIKTLSEEDMRHLNTNLVQIRNLDYLYEAMLWKNRPDFNREKYLGCDDPMNVNGRRILDMEVVLGACKNMENPSGTILEIGTAYGNMTMNMSKNAPKADIYTINIPEEEIDEGGTHVTFSIPNDSIGADYKNANCKNITQILANTLHWQPEMERINVAFIDGSHDAEFIYQDTVKVLSKCKPGSIILWHDFNPDLVDKWGWIKDVCSGVNRLYSDGHLSKRMYHVQDSWVGIYIV